MTKITFLGLGVMGYPMAGHLARAGHEVTVYNRTAAKAGTWASEHGGATGATPAEASKGAEMVMACVGNEAAKAGAGPLSMAVQLAQPRRSLKGS